MNLLRKKFSVRPNHIGYLYRKNKLERKLESGVYKFFDWDNQLDLVVLPLTGKLLTVLNQEVLTSDNIALRFSYFIEYRLNDTDLFIEKFNLLAQPTGGVFGYNYTMNNLLEAETVLNSLTQVSLRRVISSHTSEELNEKRNELLDTVPDELKKQTSEYGLEIQRLMLRDITFPKNIQDLFAKHLEAKIRAKADLENARTAVATARALKNASELMKDDDNIKFVQLLEAITKIAEKGKHTFVIGDLNQNAISGKK
jgi:regulator of protease activity HflC (stomatin/prohibitin superfamily)